MKNPDHKHYRESNRAAWNETMPYHQKANGSRWDDAFSEPEFSALSEREQKLLRGIGLSGKNVAHLCCNNGVELMSIHKMGAGRCVGFDISDEAIKEATERSTRFDFPCEFVRTDVYDIPEQYHGEFDLIFISIGCFGWLPDLAGFFSVAHALLKVGGHIFIHEQHPFTEMLPCDFDKDSDPLKIAEPYFRNEPYEENSGIDYIGKEEYEAQTKYWFVWKMSDIITSAISVGLNIIHFQEYPEDISACHSRNESAGIPMPLSFTMIVGK